MSIGVILTLIIEVLRLINRAGGAQAALKIVQSTNDTFDKLGSSKTPEDKQNAAEAISRLISGS